MGCLLYMLTFIKIRTYIANCTKIFISSQWSFAISGILACYHGTAIIRALFPKLVSEKQYPPQTPISGTKGTIIQSFHVVHRIQQSYSVIVPLLFTLLRGLPYLGRSRGEKFIFLSNGKDRMCTSDSDISQKGQHERYSYGGEGRAGTSIHHLVIQVTQTKQETHVSFDWWKRNDDSNWHIKKGGKT